jgi:hypothetical protein
MVTYNYVKFYVSIIIHLEVININVRNFNFPISFYSSPLWTPQNMTLTFFLWHMNLSTANLRNYWTEFHETWWSYRYMFLVGPKVFSFVVKGVKVIFWGVLEVININVRNFNFPIGFYSNHHPLWTPQNMTLTPFTTKLKTLGPTRNIFLTPWIK